MRAGREPRPSQHRVCAFPPQGKRRTQPGYAAPREPRGRAAPLPPSPFPAGRPGPNTLPENRQLPLLPPASLATGPPLSSGRDSLHPWVPIPLAAGSPSLPAHPKLSIIPPDFSPLHPSGGLAGRGLPPAGGPAWRDWGWQTTSSSSSSVEMPPRAPMVSPGGAGAAAGAPGTTQPPPAPASRRGLLLLLYLIKRSEGGTRNFSRLSEKRNSLRLQSQFSVLKG